jgi:hypothetical protein
LHLGAERSSEETGRELNEIRAFEDFAGHNLSREGGRQA